MTRVPLPFFYLLIYSQGIEYRLTGMVDEEHKVVKGQ
jgi:hypothetical protein